MAELVTTKTPLNPAAPANATVAASSGTALAANSSRRGAIFVNTSANTISLGFGANPAVLNKGITLEPNGGTYWMGEYDYTTQAVTAIASSASSNLAIQEFN